MYLEQWLGSGLGTVRAAQEQGHGVQACKQVLGIVYRVSKTA